MAKYVMSVNEKKIVEKVTIPQYYNEHIIPKRSGFRTISAEKPSGICPFHTDTDPSLHYWKDKKLFHCFGCGTAGNVVKMHLLFQKEQGRYINLNLAIKELAQLYDIDLELDDTGELKVESVFETAKRKLNKEQYSKNPYDITNMSVAGFRTFNSQVKNNISRNPYIDGEQAALAYSKLDITLSAYLAEVKERV